MKLELKVDHEMRADRLVAIQLPFVRRAFLQKLFRSKEVKIAGRSIQPEAKLKIGEVLTVFLPDPRRNLRPLTGCGIILEDDAIIAIDKRAGLTVHAGIGTHGDTLVDICRELLSFQPFLVHRIDRDTSGVIIIAKDSKTASQLKAEFKARRVKKIYRVIVSGKPKENIGNIRLPLERQGEKMVIRNTGQEAETHWKLLKKYENNTALLEITPITGRTHQIRVHLAAIGHPVLGDKLYGREILNSKLKNYSRHLLHASSLGVLDYQIEAPPPKEFN